MGENTKIEWTDATWNIVTGCDVVSPGCTNCYAMRLAGTRLKHHLSRAGLTRETKAGPVWNGVVKVNWGWIEQPLQWAKPRNIFVCAHGDLFHELVSKSELAAIYGIMIAAHHLRGHTLQVLTKRADRMCEVLNDEEFWELANAEANAHVMEGVDPLNRRSDDARATCDDYGPDNPPPGIWHSVSCEDQERAEERIPYLLKTPSVVRGVSAEPLLGAIEFNRLWIKDPTKLPRELRVNDEDKHLIDSLAGITTVPACHYQCPTIIPQHIFRDGDVFTSSGERCSLDWVIVGGESGPKARPMHPDWARSIRDQCAAACVSYFFKQWGEWCDTHPDWPRAVGKAMADDGTLYEPADLAYPDGARRGEALRAGHDRARLTSIYRVGKKAAGRLLDGRTHDAMPQVADDYRAMAKQTQAEGYLL